MSATIDYLAANSYRDGSDAVTVATDRVAVLLDAWERVTTTREGNPGAFPGAVWADTSPAAVSRRVLGALLDVGWTPPGPQVIAAAVAQLDGTPA